jgi:hypothetical protein
MITFRPTEAQLSPSIKSPAIGWGSAPRAILASELGFPGFDQGFAFRTTYGPWRLRDADRGAKVQKSPQMHPKTGVKRSPKTPPKCGFGPIWPD